MVDKNEKFRQHVILLQRKYKQFVESNYDITSNSIMKNIYEQLLLSEYFILSKIENLENNENFIDGDIKKNLTTNRFIYLKKQKINKYFQIEEKKIYGGKIRNLSTYVLSSAYVHVVVENENINIEKFDIEKLFDFYQIYKKDYLLK